MTSKRLIDRILEDWPVKIICFALALLLFLFYRMSNLEERFFSVPLQLEQNENLVPATTYPRMIKITLRGESNAIYPIVEDDVEAFIDLSGYNSEGEFSIAVQTRLKGTALDVDPLEVKADPEEITLRLEPRMVKKVSVIPGFKGYPETGYEFGGYTLSPSAVEVSGPRSAIERFSDIVTDTIDLSGRNISFNGTVALVNRSPLVSISGDGRVEYRVTISPIMIVRNFTDVPFYFADLDPAFEVETDIASGTIQLKGAQNELSDWSLPENALTVVCENVKEPGIYSLPVKVVIPRAYETVNNTPEQIQLTVTRKVE